MDVTGGSEVIALLRDQLAKAEALATSERERADKLLAQFITATETVRLLTAGKPADEKQPGWLRRMFGG